LDTAAARSGVTTVFGSDACQTGTLTGSTLVSTWSNAARVHGPLVRISVNVPSRAGSITAKSESL
jgi:hypothetical protein